ncbi:MAG: 3-phosphoshikimate 1-carboxyvinyltransferase [Patescibacteria group bacterium]
MKLVVQKIENIGGEITVPASKSQTIRGLILATLAKGRSVLRNALDCDDTVAARSVCAGLGAKIIQEGENLIIESGGAPFADIQKRLNAGNSGISSRFFMPALGLRKNVEEKIILDCGEQMKTRPMQSLMDALNDLGMKVKSTEKPGRLPAALFGRLRGGSARVDGLTSQYLSALLLSLPLASGDSEILVEDLRERPYVEMTEDWLREQNIRYKHLRLNSAEVFKIIGGQSYHPFDKIIPGDFSSASALIAAAVLLPGKTVLNGLDMNDKQGDKRLVEILQNMGADITVDGLKMIINGGRELQGARIDGADIPDLVPVLAVIGARAKGQTEIFNVPQARIKETDRLRSMSRGLGAMGAYVEEKADGLIVHESKLKGAAVKGYSDHRTIMALAVAGMIAEGETVIDTAEAVSKTFPGFGGLMNELGAGMEFHGCHSGAERNGAERNEVKPRNPPTRVVKALLYIHSLRDSSPARARNDSVIII